MHLELAENLVARQARPAASVMLAQQMASLDRFAGTAERLFTEGREARNFYEQLVALLADITARNEEMLREAATRDLAETVAPDLATLTTTVNDMIVRVGSIATLQELVADLPKEVPNVTGAAGVLAGQLVQRDAQLAAYPVISAIAVALAIALLVAYGTLASRNVRGRMVRAESQDAQRQQAILGLLDEITNLADGDLTVDVTVTEDFTGAIADSLNYTVQNMRELVGTITRTSERVAAGAGATQQLAQNMSAGSERQASDIASLTLQMNETANTLTGVAERAESVAEQAGESVDVARSGSETARGTINVMAALREQIQDTSKRIKRLGESSQEIGNIIELINDIAEQTGTLALNAAIQAAMAGEQGRGFAVVAEEVQRLAERASTATRQVETLVKTIQADTNEAIISMERSTHNVVNGARSAEEAGGALSRVQLSSQTMAELIGAIAGDARRQSASTTDAARRMQGVREISTQTSRASAETAKAVEELTALSAQLRQSVTGFKLPEEAEPPPVRIVQRPGERHVRRIDRIATASCRGCGGLRRRRRNLDEALDRHALEHRHRAFLVAAEVVATKLTLAGITKMTLSRVAEMAPGRVAIGFDDTIGLRAQCRAKHQTEHAQSVRLRCHSQRSKVRSRASI